MINIEKEKQKILDNINKDIERNKERAKFIEKLQIEPINIEKFNQLINEKEIINNKTILWEILKVTFPNITNCFIDWDSVYFKLNDIYFSIHFNSSKISVKSEYLRELKDKGVPKLDNYQEKVIDVLQKMKSNPKDWYGIQSVLYDTDTKPLKKVRYFLDWIFYRKYKIPKYIEKLDVIVRKWEEDYKRNIKHYYKTKRKTFKDIRKFKEILPILEQFGEIDIDKESILNFKETINGKPFMSMRGE